MSAVAISVVVPVRNARAHVMRALPALLSLVEAVEVVVVDDASQDDTVAVVERAAARSARVRIIRLPVQSGPTRARLAGAYAATGEYVWFCDADDEWDPGILRDLAAAAEATNADIVCCRAERIELDGHRWVMEGVAEETVLDRAGALNAVLDGRIRGYVWNKLIRRSLLGPLDRVPLTSQDDFLMVLDVLDRAGVVHLIPDVRYRYLEHLGSISTGADLDLGNLAHVVDAVAARCATADDPELRQDFEAFRLWFLVVPTLATAVHARWPRDRLRRVRRDLVPGIRWRTIGRLHDRQPSVARHAALIRLGGPAYPFAYRLSRLVRARRASIVRSHIREE